MLRTAPSQRRKGDHGLLVLRRGHGTPIVELDTRERMLGSMAGLGLRPEGLYFKHLLSGHLRLKEVVDQVMPKRSVCGAYPLDQRKASILVAREFLQLTLMYSVRPQNTVRPLALATCRSEVVGYFIEYIDAALPDVHSAKTERRIVEAIGEFHRRGVGHGDLLFLLNVFVTKDGRILFFDPRRQIGETNRDLIERDIMLIKNGFVQ
jgi:hypothetical protein